MSDTPNPPAFPCENIIERNAKGQFIGHEISGAGMSLRDYFAAKAMQSLVSETHTDSVIQAMAMTAYDYADAMLKARDAK